MRILPVLAMAAGVLIATPALAFHCPADIQKINQALADGPALDDARLAEVKKLRDEGKALHEAGQHQQAVDTLAKALEILGKN